ncbi:hypothetical protein OOU_Y34scaffold00783g10 [Pyricularia oryzae Y34]|uniref:Uncharacterized protein n=2 Tax=Pyricularia oryzae TaxID=318829 RepID=A0AA97PGZ9_PYRO3|nr:hypothetical protein OOU_Y34scaffold00783g10 [Pyricularia oryzae Y34]
MEFRSRASWRHVSLSDGSGHDRLLVAGKAPKLGYGREAGIATAALRMERRREASTVRTMDVADTGYVFLKD